MPRSAKARRRHNTLGAQLLAGAASGLAASLAMNLFQNSVAHLLSLREPDETSAAKAADALCEDVSGAPVKPRHRNGADRVMHYLTGAVAGAGYGLGSAVLPTIKAGRGLIYGLALWTLADQILVPALGLAPKASKSRLSERLVGLASHLLFGRTVDLGRRYFFRFLTGRLR